jgi:hypothetical protein
MGKVRPEYRAQTMKAVLVVENTLAVAAALVVVEDTADLVGSVDHGDAAVLTTEDLTMNTTRVLIMDVVTVPIMVLLVGPEASVVVVAGVHGDAEVSLVVEVASTLLPLRLTSGINSTTCTRPM